MRSHLGKAEPSANTEWAESKGPAIKISGHKETPMNAYKDKILITGATGNVGRHVVAQLLHAGARVCALTRNPDSARLPGGVELARGDLSIPETLDVCWN